MIPICVGVKKATSSGEGKEDCLDGEGEGEEEEEEEVREEAAEDGDGDAEQLSASSTAVTKNGITHTKGHGYDHVLIQPNACAQRVNKLNRSAAKMKIKTMYGN